MRLDKVIADIASNVKHARVERRTKSRLKVYRRSPELTYSKLYAWRRTPNGEVEVVPSEAEVVKLVFNGFAEGLTAQEIKRKLDQSDLRNRAGYRWTTEAITGLIRPVYAGLVPQRLGYKRSAVYKPIVTRSAFEAARTAQMRAESLEIGGQGLRGGGRSWTEPGIPDKGYGVQLSEAILRTADRLSSLAESAHGA
jgi:hypothetical protein